MGNKNYFYVVKQENNKCFIAPLDSFQGDCFNAAIQVQVTNKSNNIIGNIHIPVYLYLDREDTESLSGWDGNYLLNEDEKILTPTGYGALTNSKLSGILFGQIKKNNSLEQGLFIYGGGNRFLDATAAGTFSINSDKGYFSTSKENGIKMGSGNGTGLEIDLAAATLKYLNNNFAIDSDGVVQKLTLSKDVLISKDNINGLNSSLSALSTGIQSNANEILSIKQDYATQNNLSTLDTKVVNNANEIATIKKDYVTKTLLSTSLKDYETIENVSKLTEVIRELQEKIVELEEEINNLKLPPVEEEEKEE